MAYDISIDYFDANGKPTSDRNFGAPAKRHAGLSHRQVLDIMDDLEEIRNAMHRIGNTFNFAVYVKSNGAPIDYSKMIEEVKPAPEIDLNKRTPLNEVDGVPLKYDVMPEPALSAVHLEILESINELIAANGRHVHAHLKKNGRAYAYTGIAPRMTELKNLGLIAKAATEIDTRTGRTARLMMITDRGEKVLQKHRAAARANTGAGTR